MGDIVITEFITMDGIIGTQQWTVPYQHDEIEAYKKEELFASDGQLLGRVTYEMFAASWPDVTDEQGFADRMNAMPKYVVSRTVTQPAWNATVISAADEDELAAAIGKVKETVPRNLLVGGSARLAEFLIRRGLADELRLLTYPVVVGSGLRLFPDGLQAKFELRQTRAFPTGVLLTVHRLAAD